MALPTDYRPALTRAASRCHLAIVECATARELYCYFAPALDETATLRRVALLYRGSGRSTLTQLEQDTAREIIRERFDHRFAN